MNPLCNMAENHHDAIQHIPCPNIAPFVPSAKEMQQLPWKFIDGGIVTKNSRHALPSGCQQLSCDPCWDAADVINIKGAVGSVHSLS
jgi:hypothetical protein